MKIETKFSIGDKIVAIQCYSEDVFEECKICDGVGKILVKEKSFQCPKCYGHGGGIVWSDKGWMISTNKTNSIGYDKIVKIDVDISKKKSEVRYMLGIKHSDSYSGILYSGEDLFFTEEEALIECEKRNKESNYNV